jgi:hypothetical protein
MYKISRSWVEVLIFISFYLESCFCGDAISQWLRRRAYITFCANLGKSAMKTLAIIIQAFGQDATILPLETSKITETEKDETG